MTFRPGRFLLIAAVVVAALFSQEAAVRLALPAFDPANHLRFMPPQGDLPPLGKPNSTHRLIKNSGDYDVQVRFNRHGLRDSLDVSQAGPDDIALVGDSFAFGWGVREDQRISEQLSQRLGRRVFNLGVPTDIDGYFALLQYARDLGGHPGQVVVLVNMTDDLIDYDGRGNVVSFPSSPPPPPATEGGRGFGSAKEFLLTHSALYFLATSLVQRQPLLRSLAIKAGLIAAVQPAAARDVGDAALKAATARLVRLARSQPTLIVLIPYRGLWLGGEPATEHAVHERFRRQLEAAGLDVLDPLSAMEALPGGPPTVHFATDAHWNPKGHALVADLLAKRLARLGSVSRQAGGG